MFGFHGRVLRIRLKARQSQSEALPSHLVAQTLGGKGLAAHFLMNELPVGAEPLGETNPVILATGPVAGSGIWGSCRYGAYCKSPQTGLFAESYSGGTVGETMAGTGYDLFVIEECADEPLWVEVTPEGAVFHAAGDLWGLETIETEDRVKGWIRQNRAEAGRCGVITIGPAGENQVCFALLENDYWRSAGRTGIGAVLGRKMVKAVAFWGDREKAFAEPERIRAFVREISRLAKDDPGVKAYKTLGTPMLADIANHAGSFPTRYWHKGQAAHIERINATAVHARMDVTPNACLRCFMACGRLGVVKEGRHKGLKIEGPEYETIYAFGGLCEVNNIEDIAYLNDLCDRLGMDTISAGNLAAFTIEAVAQGRVDYEIAYGEVDRIAALLKDTAYRRGIGDILAGGIRKAAAVWGMSEQAVHVKGLEPAGYDPRILKGMGLAYGTSDRGACHLRATFYKPELSGIVDPDQIEGKAAVFTEWEDRLTLFDMLIVCRFYRDLYQWEQLSEILAATMGFSLSREEIRAKAAAVTDLIRRFNLREGLTPADDRLPPRFHDEPLPETGKVITREQMEQMLREYYAVRGWDENGTPPPAGN